MDPDHWSRILRGEVPTKVVALVGSMDWRSSKTFHDSRIELPLTLVRRVLFFR